MLYNVTGAVKGNRKLSFRSWYYSKLLKKSHLFISFLDGVHGSTSPFVVIYNVLQLVFRGVFLALNTPIPNLREPRGQLSTTACFAY
jgi:hypothetical protein